jgi:hypothetical protein
VESEESIMKHRGIGILTALVMFIGSSVTVGAATSAPGDLGGTWRGSFSQIGGVLYVAEGICVVQIHDDGTFTATVTPGPGANNQVKGSKWAGTVVSDGDHVTFRTSRGPSTTLVRRGDTLYGVTNDPLIEADIMVKLDRTSG